MYKIFFKPLLDRVFALSLLILFAPLIAIVYFATLKSMGRPVFFQQKRPGLNGEIFTIYKFRTMSNATDSNGNLLPDSERLTKVGSIVRSLSLDELPQLLNVLKGEMSFIGPRPLLVEYLPLYSEEQKRRHLVKPGITGLAQVNGRNSISWQEKFKYDIEYEQNLSFMLDVKIALLTIKKVLIKDGVNQSENITMEKFNGKN